MMRVDLVSGKPAQPNDTKAIWEAFKTNDKLPSDDEAVLQGDSSFTLAPITEGQMPDGPAQGPAGQNQAANPPPPNALPPAQAPLPGGLY